MDIGQSEISTGVSVCEPFMIESKRMEQSRMQIMHVYFILDRLMTEFIGGAISEARSKTTSG